MSQSDSSFFHEISSNFYATPNGLAWAARMDTHTRAHILDFLASNKKGILLLVRTNLVFQFSMRKLHTYMHVDIHLEIQCHWALVLFTCYCVEEINLLRQSHLVSALCSTQIDTIGSYAI